MYSKEDINNAFKHAPESELTGMIMMYTEDPIVPTDIIGDPHSSIL
jgi:glyceraldehyde 3-phosphate dehydrogenase